MKFGFVLALCAAVAPGESQVRKSQALTIWIEDQAWTPIRVMSGAQAMASRMFSAAGVRIDWRGKPYRFPNPEARSCDAPILVVISSKTGGRAVKDEMGYTDLSRNMITIWYGQIQQTAQAWPGPAVFLAHVLAHEITHLLEGTPRHSGTGVMKARWTPDDLYAMANKPLPFAEVDLELLRKGLDARISCSGPAEQIEHRMNGR